MSGGYGLSNALVTLSPEAFIRLIVHDPMSGSVFARQGGEPTGAWEPSYGCSPPLLLLLKVVKEIRESLSLLDGDEFEWNKMKIELAPIKIFNILLVFGANPDFSDYHGDSLMSWMETNSKILPLKLEREVSGFLKLNPKSRETYIADLKKKFEASPEYKKIMRFNPLFKL